MVTSLSNYGEYQLVNSSYKIGEIIYNLTETIVKNYKAKVKKKIDFKYNKYYEKMKNILQIPRLF